VLARALGATLGRKAEAVPAHHAQHVEAHHALGTRDDIGRRVALRVADVEAVTRRIREHVEHVVLRPGAIRRGQERLFLVPVLLPLLIDRLVVEARH
jgi:hypothetical protein